MGRVQFRRAALLAGAITVAGTLGYAVGTIPAAATGISFSTPTVVDPIHTFGEPDIGIDPQGRVFVSGPTGTGTQRSMWEGSVDGGRSFREVSAGPPPSALLGTEQPPGGGDTELKFDHNSKQYFADLYALACLRVATTSDGGATAQNGIAGGCETTGPGADRQWLSVFDPTGVTSTSPYKGPTPLIYLDYNDLGLVAGSNYPNGGAQWNMSTDGLNYTQAISGNPAVIGQAAPYAPFGADGYPAIDQVTGDVFEAAGLQNSDGTWSELLNIGTPDATGQLTFLDQGNTDASQLPRLLIHVADGLPASPDVLFTVLSMDTARNLYAVYAVSAGQANPGQRQVYVAAASAAGGWRTWTKPVRVSNSPSMVAVMPWIKAGAAGRADAVWYGSNQTVDPSTSTSSTLAWDVFMSQVVFPVNKSGGITGAAPSLTEVKATPHPMHFGTICLIGTDCITIQGNRNLADFFEVTADSSGAAEIVYDDTSNGLIQPGFTPDNQQLVDHAGAPLVTILRQSSGTGLLGTQVSSTSNGVKSSISDPGGDALYPVIGGAAVPGMDITNAAVNLSGGTLTITVKVGDLASPATTIASLPGATNLQYVTRWQMGNTIYYAAMENTATNQPIFYAGAARSVDLCSVSACFPHVLTFPEPAFGGSTERGSVSCPAAPSASNPCTLTISVRASDVGSPASSSLLQELGSYSFGASTQSGEITNAQAQADDVPLEIDGACCINAK